MYKLLRRLCVLTLVTGAGPGPAHAVSLSIPAVDSLCIIHSISFSGNHSTKESILRRELTFSEGDTLTMRELQILLIKSRENLLNTSLFNFVTLDTTFLAGVYSLADVTFKLVERWYLWPLPYFQLVDRNFNSWLQHQDMERITYGFYLQHDNMRGRREKLVLSFRSGYDKVWGLSYEIPYLTRGKRLGLLVSTAYQRNHSVPYESYNNKEREYRAEDQYLKTSLVSAVKLSYRKGIHHYHYLTLTQYQYDFSDKLIQLNPHYSDYGKHPAYLSLSFRYKADYRDYQPFPLKGSFFDMELTKVGLAGKYSTQPDAFSVKSSARKYEEISPRWHYGLGVTGRMTLQDRYPYFLTTGLGYDQDFVRGYEYYVVEGQDYVLFRSDVKWTLLPTHVSEIRFLPQTFGLVHYTAFLSAFADAGYVRTIQYGNLNLLGNRWLLGGGIGLQLVSYYDKVFRLEVSANDKEEAGVFLHFVAPI